MGWFSGLFGRSPGPEESVTVPARVSRDDTLRVVWREGSYPIEAVGESHYQPALARLCGGHSRFGHERACRARLVPEPTNPYDARAHKVIIDGAHVGYAPRDHAARLVEASAAVGRPGAVIEVEAVIRGGWRTNQHDEGGFGVRLGVPLRGAIEFDGHARPAPDPAPKAARPPAAPVILAEADLAALEALVQQLRSTPLLEPAEAERRRTAFYRRAASRMVSQGVSSGVATGAPDHLVQGEDHFRAEMARMDNLLGEQVRIFQKGLDQWFAHGETFAPYYPFRIAVILRKARRGDLERAFLEAYVEHFADIRPAGSRYAQIIDRAAKLGVPIPVRS